MPAVASDGGPPAQTSTPCPGAATSVSAPFSRQTQPNVSAACRTAAKRCASTHADSTPSMPRELAGVRREHRRRRAPNGLELEERVGVDDGRQVRLLEQPPHELASALVPPEAGADRERARLLHRVEDLLERTLHGFEEPRLQHGQRLGGSGDGDVARVRPERRLRCEACGAREPRRAADDEHRRAVLRVAGPLARDEPEDGRRHERVLRHGVLEADVAHDELAAVKAAGRDDVADLRRVERDRHRRPDGGAGDFAGIRIDPRRQVDREHRRLGRIHLRDDLGGVRPRLAVEPGAEQPVEDDVAARAPRLPRWPAARSASSAIRASPPFAPPPHTAPNDRASGKWRNASSATARPARSMSTRTSCPASASFISAAV